MIGITLWPPRFMLQAGSSGGGTLKGSIDICAYSWLYHATFKSWNRGNKIREVVGAYYFEKLRVILSLPPTKPPPFSVLNELFDTGNGVRSTVGRKYSKLLIFLLPSFFSNLLHYLVTN